MHSELSRISTFRDWPASRVSPISLARAGLYYTGRGDTVKCSSCKQEFSNWEQKGEPLDEHRGKSSNCSFITGYERSEGASNFLTDDEKLKATKADRQTSGNSKQVVQQDHVVKQSQPNFSERVGLYRQHNWTTDGTAVAITPTHTQNTHMTTHETQPQPRCNSVFHHDHDANFLQCMKSEQERRSTFSGFPENVPQEPDQLAAAGFIYTGTADKTKCVFCRGILKNWEAHDIPMEEHKRHFPMCPFVNGRDVGNIPISHPEENSFYRHAARSDIQENSMQQILSEPPIQLHTRKMPQVFESKKSQDTHKRAENIPAMQNKDPLVTTLLQECDTMRERQLCKVCLDQEFNTVFLPCSHLCCCQTCAPKLQNCPVCRQYIKATMKVIKS